MMSPEDRFQQILDESVGVDLLSAELFLVNFEHGYLGRFDKVAPFHGKDSLLELKVVKKHKEWRWVVKDDLPQLSAYWFALKGIISLEQTALLYFQDKVGKLDIKRFTPQQMDRLALQWLKLLHEFREQQNQAQAS